MKQNNKQNFDLNTLQLTKENNSDFVAEREDIEGEPSALSLPICLITKMSKLSPDAVCAALHLYYLCDHLRAENVLMPTNAELGTRSGLTTSNAKRAQRELIEKGFLSVHEDRSFALIYDGVSFATDHLKDEDFTALPIRFVTMMPELSPASVCTALYLYYYSNYIDDEIIMPTVTELGVAIGLTAHRIKQTLNELSDKGVIDLYEDGSFDLMYDEPFSPDKDAMEVELGEPGYVDLDEVSAELDMDLGEVQRSMNELVEAGVLRVLPDGRIQML